MAKEKNIQAQGETPEAVPPKLDVAVRLIEPRDNLLGFANIIFNNAFVVEDISIVQGEKGIFAGMPSKPDPSKPSGYRQTARPIGEFRGQLNGAVAEAYYAQVEKVRAQAMAHVSHGQAAPGQKQSIPQQLAQGKAWAAQENAKSTAQQGQPALVPGR